MPDPDFARQDSLTEHNLEITLEDDEQAQAAVESLKDAGLDARVTLDAEEDKRASLRGDMRDELEATVMGPGSVGPQTKAQTKGIVKWVSICGVTGAIALFLVGLVAWPSTTGLLSSGAIGLTGGAVFGFVIGGFLGPRKHNEGYTEAESRPVVGVHAHDPAALDEAEKLLQGVDVARSDRVNANGRPVDSPSKDTRPLRGETPT